MLSKLEIFNYEMTESISSKPRKASLEMTDKDHKDIGSTPPDELIENPGKNKAELMTDTEIEQYLIGKQHLIEKFKEGGSTFEQSVVKDYEIDLRLCIDYLKSIGRLPKSFEEANE